MVIFFIFHFFVNSKKLAFTQYTVLSREKLNFGLRVCRIFSCVNIFCCYQCLEYRQENFVPILLQPPVVVIHVQCSTRRGIGMEITCNFVVGAKNGFFKHVQKFIVLKNYHTKDLSQ